jgi:putative transposase
VVKVDSIISQKRSVVLPLHNRSIRLAAWYRPRIDWAQRDGPVVAGLSAALAKIGSWGFGLCFDWLRHHGRRWNLRRAHRVYCELRLNLPRRQKRRLPPIARQPMIAPTTPNQMWGRTSCRMRSIQAGRCPHTLNVIDESNREALAIEIDTSLPSSRAIRLMEQLGDSEACRGRIGSDNGPKLRAQTFVDWCALHRITMCFIQPTCGPFCRSMSHRAEGRHLLKAIAPCLSRRSQECGYQRRSGTAPSTWRISPLT